MASSRDQALSLLAAANNHGDLSVKLSSLKQAKDILLSVDSSLAAELFPYLAELQSSPQTLVRKSLIETVEEIGLRAMEHSSTLMPVLLAFLRDTDPVVARQSIISGTKFFRMVLEKMATQFHRYGKVERWVEDLWMSMVKFKDIIHSTALEPGFVSTRLLALKFLETYVLLFTPDSNDYGRPIVEGGRHVFNIARIAGGYPSLDPVVLMGEARRTLASLLDLLHAASGLSGPLTITVISCLAAIARKRPQHFNAVFSELLNCEKNPETVKGFHGPSIQYSLRSAFLGFLRCTHPSIMEARERLVRALRAMNAGEAAEHVIRQVDKSVRNSERASRDARLVKEDQQSSQMPFPGDLMKKRSMPSDDDDLVSSQEVAMKRTRYISDNNSFLPVHTKDPGHDTISANGASPNVPMMDGNLTPVEQMIAMIGALLAEGERGAESLGVLISKIHPDLLADIVITNMKHLPDSPPPLASFGKLQVDQQISSVSNQSQTGAVPSSVNSRQSPACVPQTQHTSAVETNTLLSDASVVNNPIGDPRRDPRRFVQDPRRQDPRLVVPAEAPSVPVKEEASEITPVVEALNFSKPLPFATTTRSASGPFHTNKKRDDEIVEHKPDIGSDELTTNEDVVNEKTSAFYDANVMSDVALSPSVIAEDDSASIRQEVVQTDDSDSPSVLEVDEHPSAIASVLTPEETETQQDLPDIPSYIELSQEHIISLRQLSFKRIIESCKHLHAKECSATRMALIARLIAQIDAGDDLVGILQKRILEDYQWQKGHELVLHVLYHLHSLGRPELGGDSEFAGAVTYEKLLLAVAESLLDQLPASDKSFSRLLSEAPFLPSSVLKLLDDLCYSDISDLRGKVLRDPDCVTQGLGAVWSLILGRPQYRKACLDIALKCAVHAQDEIRSKAIRLVTNKLYPLSYISETIEQFATNILLSVIDENASDAEHPQPGQGEEIAEEVGAQNTSAKVSQASDSLLSDSDISTIAQPSGQGSSISLPEAQRLISLYFALCTKKPCLLHLVFNTYSRAPKAVKQAVHRHIPVLIRALGSSSNKLLQVISDPPQGSENLLMQVLQILTEETIPSQDLIATVKHLYETKLKDVTILIPMLSSFSKDEVLPIFPRLVNLPADKFQKALAHILQGSAHTGPALTPVEVLVAIHDIIPERDGLPLKKVMDVCSACFEQRTVFTQQVLAKALNQMVDQTPLPLLFMRTVIQAIDAFPTLVDFVMEILSKLVNKQIWRMPKLWVGFLKCVAQTQPHSFPVLLQLPPPQLESSLNKYAGLRGPLAAFANQQSIRASLPRSVLSVLGLAGEPLMQKSHVSSSLPPDTSPSVQGTTMT